MKKNNWPFLLLAILFVFTGCKTEPVKVGFLLHSVSHDRWQRDKDLITENVEALGGEVLFRQANNDQMTQNKQARELIDLGADVLVVVSSDQDLSAEIIRMAHQKEVPVVAYDRLIKDCDLDFYVSTNSVRVGELQAAFMTSIVPKGNYGLIMGDEHDNNALMLFIGQMNKLQDKIENGNIRIVYSEYTTSWTPEEGYRCAKEMLEQNNNEIDAIIAGSDELAYGIHQALQEAGLLGQVGIVSQDADLRVIRQIVKNNHTATIYKPLGEMARKTAEVAIKLAKKQKIDKDYSTVSNGKRLVPAYELEPILVNKDNITSTVVAEGFHKSEEIF
jgi:D-xylose transport system substrate-binding protein